MLLGALRGTGHTMGCDYSVELDQVPDVLRSGLARIGRDFKECMDKYLTAVLLASATP